MKRNNYQMSQFNCHQLHKISHAFVLSPNTGTNKIQAQKKLIRSIQFFFLLLIAFINASEKLSNENVMIYNSEIFQEADVLLAAPFL